MKGKAGGRGLVHFSMFNIFRNLNLLSDHNSSVALDSVLCRWFIYWWFITIIIVYGEQGCGEHVG